MAFIKKTWKDRLVEYAGRRTLTRVSGSIDSTLVVDVARNEGTVSQAGDAFSAANMNDLEQRISDEFSTLNNNLGGLKFAQDEKGNWGYIPSGADTVLPFKSGVISLGVGIEFDVSSYAGYKNFTSDNFIIEYNNSISSSSGDNGFKKENVGTTYHWPSVGINTYKNYNSATGILTAYINVSSTITPTICGTRTEKHNVNAYLIP